MDYVAQPLLQCMIQSFFLAPHQCGARKKDTMPETIAAAPVTRTGSAGFIKTFLVVLYRHPYWLCQFCYKLLSLTAAPNFYQETFYKAMETDTFIFITLFYQPMATTDDFHKLDIRVGKIIKVEDFPEAKKPAYKLTIDLDDEVGIKQSSAQLVKNYPKEILQGKLVLCVVNFPPRKIGSFVSEVLTLGVPDSTGECVLVVPDKAVPIGGKLY